jgi:hypothetical protein
VKQPAGTPAKQNTQQPPARQASRITTTTTVATTTTTQATTTITATTTTESSLVNQQQQPPIQSLPSLPGLLAEFEPMSVLETTIPTTTRAPTPSTPPKMSICYIESGINYPGNDIGGKFVANSSECCHHCGRMPGCVSFSFHTEHGYCFYKGIMPDEKVGERYLEFVSGVIHS